MPLENRISDHSKDNICYINNSFKPLSPFLKAFLLNCNKYQSQKCTIVSFLFFIVPILVLGCLNILTLYYKIIHIYNDMLISIKYTDAVQVTFDYFQYIVDLYYVHKYGKNMQEYYNTHQKIDQALCFTYCPELKKKLLKLVVFFGLSWTVTCVCDYCAWWYSIGLESASLFSVSYIYILIKILTSLDLTSHVMQIEFRLRNIADKAQSWLETNNVRMESNIKNNWYTHSDVPDHSLGNVEDTSEKNVPEFKWLCKSYLWLIEQVDFINDVFGARILLNSLSLLVDMVRFTNIAVRIHLGSQHLNRNTLGIFPVISTVMRLTICIAILVSMVNHCELAYRERNRIIDILDRFIIIKEPSQNMGSALSEFQRLVQSRPIDFHTSNLTRLDYSLLSSMASIVVTYTVILLQSVN